MDEQQKVHPYSGILPSSKKKQTTGTHSNVDKSQDQYAKWHEPHVCIWKA